MRDCTELSAKAQAIFDRLEPFFPPDPWKNPGWKKEGIVIDNGTFDLRKSADRERLRSRHEGFLGNCVFLAAKSYHRKTGSLKDFEHQHYSKLVLKSAEILVILDELDFQIEIYDLLED